MYKNHKLKHILSIYKNMSHFNNFWHKSIEKPTSADIKIVENFNH